MCKQIESDSKACSSPEFSVDMKETCEKSFNTQKLSKKERWPKEQAAILVNSWNG